jgi:hypothetical protein
MTAMQTEDGLFLNVPSIRLNSQMVRCQSVRSCLVSPRCGMYWDDAPAIVRERTLPSATRIRD